MNQPLPRATGFALFATVALLSACGGGDAPPASTPTAPVATPSPSPAPAPTGAFSLADEVAAARNHSAYGAIFRAGTHPSAPDGLTLPTPPSGSCMSNQVTVTSLAQFNTEAAGSCKRITLAPSSTEYIGAAVITGQDIEAVFTGTTITPTDDSWALQVTQDARRVKTIGGTFNNLYVVGGTRWSPGGAVPNFVQDVHIFGASFTGLYTQGRSTTYYGDGAVIRAHRFVLEHATARTANGGFFIEPGSSNIILANSNIVVPKLDRHENPARANGADLVMLIDSRLRTELGPGQSGPIKHTWRMHGSSDGAGGRILVKRVQSEGGGAMAQYPGVETANLQSSHIVVEGWRYYRAPGVEGNNIAAFPNLNTYAGSSLLGSTMNAYLWMADNTVFHNDQTAGSDVISGTNRPPGSVTSTVYAAYTEPPAWTFR